MQPPPGGCVLKLGTMIGFIGTEKAATFGWLCVETVFKSNNQFGDDAATFGWLCVETVLKAIKKRDNSQPPSGGCVLKPPNWWIAA